MKSKVAVIILVVISLLLGVALLVVHNDSQRQKEADTANLMKTSNNLAQVELRLKEQQSVNSTLETNLLTKTEEAKTLSSNLNQTTATLTETKTTLVKTEAEVKAQAAKVAEEIEKAEKAAKAAKVVEDELSAKNKNLETEVAQRDARINSLNLTQEDLTKKIGSLNGSIVNLNQQIAKTEKELDTTKGDKDFLLKELKRMQGEKSELERQMNDLAFLREQVKHLKEEMAVSRRLDWMRRGITGDTEKKGGQLMQDGFRASAVKTNAPGSKLNVELKKDGTVTITPATNAPPKAPTPK